MLSIKNICILFKSGLLFILISSCNSNTSSNGIIIATAANMQPAITEISSSFSKKTGINCKIVVSSSGKLTAQIKEGAPYNVFVSANMKYPREIYSQKLGLTSPKIYGYGKLVLWSAIDSITPSTSLLTNSKIKHIAIANPKTAPYGTAAIEVLEHYNLYDSIASKLVYGESISQTNQFILSKSASIGFTAMSVVLDEKIKKIGKWVALDSTAYSPIAQGVIIINQNIVKNKNATAFYEYLFSKEGQEIVKKYGYSINE
ncbi:molybdate transport system substrate-binding protein [Maribacter vaceletii]|uniref:Molybdate transport system substrate-binding protein n=1 Tax=Maribacter vaceletii TaxID=1206816 RepID=A0A495DTC1_9FLAO|nr:molybdate ABC transporter substrate-binding protein [Maribacter vaceletii]RKR07874.1 molybdate transport system substrate-binding protein [Maribacter vaceletii]